MAGDGSFTIRISAVDRATSVLDKMNKRLAAINRPFENFARAARRFSDVSGLQKVAGGFRRVAQNAALAADRIGRIITPLGAITGAASAAGLYRLMAAWAQFGTNLGFAAQRIGMSAERLQALQGAARLAGVSAESLTSGLQTLGQTLTDAVGGRNPEALVYLNTLGINFRDVNGHARSVSEVLPQVADRIAAIKDPFLQARVATALFGGAAEQLLPFLRMGSKGIEEYAQKARQYGVMNQQGVDAANRLRMAQTSLSMAVEGLGNAIAARLSPFLTPLLQSMADWIGKNRDLIAQRVDEYVRGFANWLQSIDWKAVGQGIISFATGVNDVVNYLGGWKRAIEIILGIMAASWFAGVVAPIIQVGTALGGVIAKFGVLTLRTIPAAIAGFGKLRSAAVEAIEAENAAATAGEKAATRGASSFNKLLGLASQGMFAFDLLGRYFHGGTFEEGGLARPVTPQLLQQFPGLAGPLAEAAGVTPAPPEDNFFNRAHRWLFGPDKSAEAAADTTKQEGIRAKQISDQLIKLGWTPEQAAGLAANWMRESHLNPTAVGDQGAAYGIGQWHPDRQAAFQRLFGHPIQQSTLSEQVTFADWELRHGNEQAAGRDLMRAKTAGEAGAIVSTEYERPADREGEAALRGQMAEALAKRLPGIVVPNGPAASVDAVASSAGAAPSGTVSVDITHRNPPPGTSVSVQSSGNSIRTAPVRIETGMPLLAALP